MHNHERILHNFTLWCAEKALKMAGVTDPRSWGALAAKRLWMDGRATDDELAWVKVSSRAVRLDPVLQSSIDIAVDKTADVQNAASTAAMVAHMEMLKAAGR